MKNYRKSDYALNKFSEGIVYQFSDGTLEISMADYLRDNPDKTEADFLALKALSDEIYLEQVRLETAQGNKTVSMTESMVSARCCRSLQDVAALMLYKKS